MWTVGSHYQWSKLNWFFEFPFVVLTGFMKNKKTWFKSYKINSKNTKKKTILFLIVNATVKESFVFDLAFEHLLENQTFYCFSISFHWFDFRSVRSEKFVNSTIEKSRCFMKNTAGFCQRLCDISYYIENERKLKLNNNDSIQHPVTVIFHWI